MLRFGYPTYFYALLLIPILIILALYFYKSYQKYSRSLYDTHLAKDIIQNNRNNRIKFKMVLWIIFIFFLIIALVDPQIGTRLEIVKRKGVDIVLAVDVSKSMLSSDIKPSRLEKAKKEILDFLDILEGDRIGLIVFAGAAYTQCPLTIDYGAMEMYVDLLSPDLVPKPGTAIGSAIKEALRAFPDSTSKYKVMILMTDGEDHATTETQDAINIAKEKNIKIYTIGFGSPSGSLIPIYDEKGNMIGYKKDENGNYITSRLNAELLRNIANQTGGKFYLATTSSRELKQIYNDIQKLQKKEISEREYTQFEDRYQIFLILALIVLLYEVLMFEKWKKEK